MNYKDFINSIEFKSYLNSLNKSIVESLLDKNLRSVIIGNLFYDHLQPDFHLSRPIDECLEKRKRLFDISQRSTTMLEIGVNAGHSSLLCLIANKELKYIGNDIVNFSLPGCNPEIYVERAFKWLKDNFDDRVTLIKGNCLIEIPKFVKNNRLKIDFLHLDGDKSTYKKDFFNIIPILQKDAYIVFDDTQQPHLQNLVDNLVKEGYVYRDSVFPKMNGKYRNEIVRYTGKI